MSIVRTMLAASILAGLAVGGCAPAEPEATAPAELKAAAPAEAKPTAPVNALRVDGLVSEWAVIVFNIKPDGEREQADEYFRSTFDKDYLAPVGGEAKAVLSAETALPYKDQGGKDQTAKAGLLKADTIGWLASEWDDQAGAGRKVIYASCHLKSDKPQKVKCYFGSDDEAKIWLNGKVVHETYLARSCEDRDDTFDIELKKGLNPLMVKASQRSVSWVFVLEAHAAK